jgi:hypothetical protein
MTKQRKIEKLEIKKQPKNKKDMLKSTIPVREARTERENIKISK